MTWVRQLILFIVVFITTSCSSHSGNFEQVQFTIPSSPSVVLQPLMDQVEVIGILCISNMESTRQLDVEKVLALLSNALLNGLTELKDVKVTSQDEIIWKMSETIFDSSSVYEDSVQLLLRKRLQLDALVLVELRKLQTRMLPMAPLNYGMNSNTGMDMSIDLQISLINLHSRESWTQGGKQRNVEPVRLQLFGNNNQGEQQLLMAISRPVQRFMTRLAPPPKKQIRQFDTGHR